MDSYIIICMYVCMYLNINKYIYIYICICKIVAVMYIYIHTYPYGNLCVILRGSESIGQLSPHEGILYPKLP